MRMEPGRIACIDDPSDRLRSDVLAVLPDLLGETWIPLPGGRSNAVWRVGSVVVKKFLSCRATPLFPNDPDLEATALEQLADLHIAPGLLAKGAGWVAWRHCTGQSWQGEDGLADLLLALQTAPRFPGLRARPMGAEAILADAKSFAPPGLPIPPEPRPMVLPQPSLLHGDFVPGNILATDLGLRMIDWQCPAWGDPVDDLALFLSPAMQRLYRGRPLVAAEISVILQQLPEPMRQRYMAFRPVLHWRIAAHCALRARRGDTGYAEALGLELAAL